MNCLLHLKVKMKAATFQDISRKNIFVSDKEVLMLLLVEKKSLLKALGQKSTVHIHSLDSPSIENVVIMVMYPPSCHSKHEFIIKMSNLMAFKFTCNFA